MESFNEEKFREFGEYVKEVGIKFYKVVKYFFLFFVKVVEEVGVFLSVIVSRKNIEEVIK